MPRLVPVPGWLVGLAVLGLLAGCGSTPAARGDAEHDLAVTGFALDDVSGPVLDRDAPALRTVGVDGVTLRGDGASVRTPSSAAYAVARRAHARGLHAELLVSNFHGDDFSPAVAHRMLADPQHRAAVVRTLVATVGRQRFDGIAVDLESLRADDAAGLVAFLRELGAALPDDATMSIDLMAATTTKGYAALGYDLGAIADAVDVVALMAYDQHGPGWSGPGPIGALGWQRRALAALLDVVPARQVDLGVAGYGYTWTQDDGAGGGGEVSDRRARALARNAGVTSSWHEDDGEWSATLRDGTRMWWSDRRSWDLRVRLARRHHLHGLALWRLGSADSVA